MRKLVVLFIAVAGIATAQGQNSHRFAGSWQGKMEISAGVSLRMIFTVTEKDGVLTSTSESPDQSAVVIPCESTTIAGDTLLIEMKKLGAAYKGILINETMLTGSFSQGSFSFPLTLQRAAVKKPENDRPQSPQPPFPYQYYDVTFANEDNTAQFGATLTVPGEEVIPPAKSKTFPVAIIISGSGQQNRDGTMFRHKPYAVLADYLTRKGIAVLRIDDRMTGSSTGDVLNSTSATFAKDIEAAVTFLTTRKEIDPKKIGLIGHSEGGIIAPMVAAANKTIAFIVLWGAPVIGGKEINTRQNMYSLQKAGIDSVAREAFGQLNRQLLSGFALAKDSTALAERIQPIWQQWKATQPGVVKAALGVAGDTITGQPIYAMYYGIYKIPWFRFFVTYDPAVDLAKVRCPVLAIIGSKDTQVEAGPNLERTAAILKAGHHKKYKTAVLPGLNHMFQTAVSGDVNEYATIEETIAPAALEAISSWLQSIL